MTDALKLADELTHLRGWLPDKLENVGIQDHASLAQLEKALLLNFETIISALRSQSDVGALKEIDDATWEQALDCALRQFEKYHQSNKLGTMEWRRVALGDALQHAVGIIRLALSPSSPSVRSEGNGCEHKWIFYAVRGDGVKVYACTKCPELNPPTLRDNAPGTVADGKDHLPDPDTFLEPKPTQPVPSRHLTDQDIIEALKEASAGTNVSAGGWYALNQLITALERKLKERA